MRGYLWGALCGVSMLSGSEESMLSRTALHKRRAEMVVEAVPCMPQVLATLIASYVDAAVTITFTYKGKSPLMPCFLMPAANGVLVWEWDELSAPCGENVGRARRQRRRGAVCGVSIEPSRCGADHSAIKTLATLLCATPNMHTKGEYPEEKAKSTVSLVDIEPRDFAEIIEQVQKKSQQLVDASQQDRGISGGDRSFLNKFLAAAKGSKMLETLRSDELAGRIVEFVPVEKREQIIPPEETIFALQ